MAIKRVRVEFSVSGQTPGGEPFGFAAGPGLLVDVDGELAPGVRVAQHTDPSWFEEIEPAVANEPRAAETAQATNEEPAAESGAATAAGSDRRTRRSAQKES